MDWNDPEAQHGFLAAIVADTERLQGQALTLPQAADREDPDRAQIMEAATLLCKLLLRGTECSRTNWRCGRGVRKDRIVSVSDPEIRHGHQSSQQCFDGHKTALVVEAESQLITAVAVLPVNASDYQGP